MNESVGLELTSPVRDFVVEQIEISADEFGGALGTELLASGWIESIRECRAFIYPDAADRAMNDPGEGGMAGPDQESAFIEFLYEQMTGGPDDSSRLLVLEELLMDERTFTPLESSISAVETARGWLHVADENVLRDDILDAFRRQYEYPGISAIVDCDASHDWRSSAGSRELLEAIRQPRLVCLSAWDGEGYMVVS